MATLRAAGRRRSFAPSTRVNWAMSFAGLAVAALVGGGWRAYCCCRRDTVALCRTCSHLPAQLRGLACRHQPRLICIIAAIFTTHLLDLPGSRQPDGLAMTRGEAGADSAGAVLVLATTSCAYCIGERRAALISSSAAQEHNFPLATQLPTDGRQAGRGERSGAASSSGNVITAAQSARIEIFTDNQATATFRRRRHGLRRSRRSRGVARCSLI